MEEAFTFDLSHFPSSLFNDNGTLRTMAKADLANSLKLTTVSGAEPEKLKIVLDGGLLGGGGGATSKMSRSKKRLSTGQKWDKTGHFLLDIFNRGKPRLQAI